MEDSATQSEPAIIVIFGITGDLSNRYLLPALYHLVKDLRLHPQSRIVGVTRRNLAVEELIDKAELRERTSLFQMDLDDPDAYDGLLARLNEIEEQAGVCLNRLYYLSIPPQAYRPVVRLLGERGLNTSCQHGKAATRLLVEKPFGFDLASARELIDETAQAFREEQVFRIDHYMAKNTVQQMLAFRFNNTDDDTQWNQGRISDIQIMAKESIGIEGRAAFYEPLGALRDIIQSHLLQILGIITMDKPAALDSSHIHPARRAALEAIEPMPADKVPVRAVRGQYRGYRDEVNNPESTTETFAAIQVFIKNPRWQNVPITLLTGKALDERRTEVIINFHDGQQQFQLHEQGRSSAYERVLTDAVRGDHAVFATSAEILASWRIIQPVLAAWAQSGNDLIIYEPGSQGPPLPTA